MTFVTSGMLLAGSQHTSSPESPRGASVFAVLAIDFCLDSDRCKKRLQHRNKGSYEVENGLP